MVLNSSIIAVFPSLLPSPFKEVNFILSPSRNPASIKLRTVPSKLISPPDPSAYAVILS